MPVFKVAESLRKLQVVAVPIGNLQEMSPRAVAAFSAADALVCEDTRVTSVLLKAHGLRKTMISNEGSREEAVGERVVSMISEGKSVVLVSDAGYPLLSDPGMRIVRRVYEAGYAVEVVNGPSSLMHAAVASGFSLDEFFFAGFLPAKAGERRRRLKQLAAMACTVIAFEAPHRVMAALGDVAEAMGDREMAVCRELTKLHETIYRGTAQEISKTMLPKGEIVLVFGPASKKTAPVSLAGELEEVAVLVKGGMRLKDACKQVALWGNHESRQLYDFYLTKHGRRD